MTNGVQGYRDLVMPQQFLHVLGMGAPDKHEAGYRVPQVIQADARESYFSEQRSKGPLPVGVQAPHHHACSMKYLRD